MEDEVKKFGGGLGNMIFGQGCKDLNAVTSITHLIKKRRRRKTQQRWTLYNAV